MIAFVFDTETNGLVANRTMKAHKLPEVIEFFGAIVDLQHNHIIEEFDTLIKPQNELSSKPNPGDKESIIKITGITNERLADKPTFAQVAPRIISIIERAPVVIAHNASFDVEMIDIELARIGQSIRWPRVLCSVEQTIHLVGRRLKLHELYYHLFQPEKFMDAHRAKDDTKALIRCCVELVRRGEW
jgi:DNA polymerase III epsilon subunit-like protein